MHYTAGLAGAVGFLDDHGHIAARWPPVGAFLLARPGRWTGRGYTATDYVRSADPPATTEKGGLTIRTSLTEKQILS